MVTASDDGTARIWDAESGAELATLAASEPVNSAAFSPDGDRVVTASDDARRGSGTPRAAPSSDPARPRRLGRSAAFSPDGERVVTASNDGTARIWDAESGASS